MSTLETDLIQASTGTNTAIKIKGKGTGVVKIGDGELSFPDADGSANQIIKTDGSGTLSFIAQPGGGAWAVKESGTKSGAALYNFTSITKPVMMYLRNIVPTTDATYLKLETSSDGGSSYDTGASDYAYNNVEMLAGSSNNNGSTGTSNLYIAGQAMYNSGGEVTNCVFTLLNPEDSTRYTALQHWTVTSEYSTYVTFKTWIGGGQRNEVAIVNAFRLTTISGNNFEFDYELLELN
tara:strand:- start:1705 stop:2412 length:708 start_codon:yes stop_codon:yes gene_type:complete